MDEKLQGKLIHAKHVDESVDRESSESRVQAARRQATPAPAGPSSPDNRKVVKPAPKVEAFPPELRSHFAKMAEDRK